MKKIHEKIIKNTSIVCLLFRNLKYNKWFKYCLILNEFEKKFCKFLNRLNAVFRKITPIVVAVGILAERPFIAYKIVLNFPVLWKNEKFPRNICIFCKIATQPCSLPPSTEKSSKLTDMRDWSA